MKELNYPFTRSVLWLLIAPNPFSVRLQSPRPPLGTDDAPPTPILLPIPACGISFSTPGPFVFCSPLLFVSKLRAYQRKCFTLLWKLLWLLYKCSKCIKLRMNSFPDSRGLCPWTPLGWSPPPPRRYTPRFPMCPRNETVTNLLHAVSSTGWIRVGAGDAERTDWQVTITFFVGVTPGNKPAWICYIHTYTDQLKMARSTDCGQWSICSFKDSKSFKFEQNVERQSNHVNTIYINAVITNIDMTIKLPLSHLGVILCPSVPPSRTSVRSVTWASSAATGCSSASFVGSPKAKDSFCRLLPIAADVLVRLLLSTAQRRRHNEMNTPTKTPADCILLV